MEIPRGQLVAIMGNSGCGKTTLLRLIGGQLKPTGGDLFVDGQSVPHMSHSELYAMRRRMGMLFQFGALFTDISVFDNVAYLMREHTNLPEEMIRDMVLMKLNAVGLRGAHALMPSELSGGMARRVALARAIALDPMLIMYDEPFAGLDPISMGVIGKLIRTLSDALGATTLLVTHDQEEALVMADRVAMLKDGRLLQIATPREIYQQPSSVAVAEFVGLSTILPARVSAPGKIDLGFAELFADTGARAVGSGLHAMVRPEHVQADPPPACVNRLQGHPGAQRYLGALTRYDFEVPGASKPFLAESAVPAARAIAIAPEHIRLLDH